MPWRAPANRALGGRFGRRPLAYQAMASTADDCEDDPDMPDEEDGLEDAEDQIEQDVVAAYL
eukprot:12902830-Prorocentrum_lima.AAC.1